MAYAIISVGGKQYRVSEGDRLLVERLSHEEGETFHPGILMLGGNGEADFAPKGAQVTARVVAHPLGEKVRIGKYRPKKGYKRHTGYRSRLTQIQIESIGKAEERTRKPKREAAESDKPAAPKRKTTKKTKAEE